MIKLLPIAHGDDRLICRLDSYPPLFRERVGDHTTGKRDHVDFLHVGLSLASRFDACQVKQVGEYCVDPRCAAAQRLEDAWQLFLRNRVFHQQLGVAGNAGHG